MLTRLKLERFKNFEQAELPLGPLTVLVGENATGKSNLRDAFRFLHGIARGYTLAEIIGEKWIEGGVLQWRGIRGGNREIAFSKRKSFVVEIGFEANENNKKIKGSYGFKVHVGENGKSPRVMNEKLVIEGKGDYIFNTNSTIKESKNFNPEWITVQLPSIKNREYPEILIRSNQLAISQPVWATVERETGWKYARMVIDELESMRFLDINPDAMRIPSIPGQTILGDRGENISSVLQAICEDKALKRAMIEWLRELTPMDAKDFLFIPDQTGKILVSLKEKNGQTISAHSASDGTLRFLAMLAALLGPEPARFYFFEELDNGIHPTRLHLLLQLIEQKVSEGRIQMVASTHSPNLLGSLSPRSLESASLTYRLENRPEARIKRILDIPHAREVLKTQDVARLHASGWMENVMSFLEEESDE